MYKTLLISAAFLGASIIGAAAQSSPSPSPSPSGGGNVSAATHCKDKATGQARLKTAANPSAPSGGTTGAGSMSGSSPSGSTGSAAGAPGSSPGTSGPVAANLPDCP